MKTNSKTRFISDQHPDDDPALHYRYDGVDEDGQHYLERIEYDENDEEVYTEDYIPIAFWNRRASSTLAEKDKQIAALEGEVAGLREALRLAVGECFQETGREFQEHRQRVQECIEQGYRRTKGNIVLPRRKEAGMGKWDEKEGFDYGEWDYAGDSRSVFVSCAHSEHWCSNGARRRYET